MFALTLALIALAQDPAALVADIPEVTVQTYVVDDSQFRPVRDALHHARLTTPEGRRAVSRVTWRYDYRWRIDPAGRCDPASATTDLKITMILPTLSPDARFSAPDRARWPVYIGELVAYERDRIALMMQGREDTVTAMKAASDCASMLQAANAAHARTRQTLAVHDDRQTARRRRILF